MDFILYEIAVYERTFMHLFFKYLTHLLFWKVSVRTVRKILTTVSRYQDQPNHFHYAHYFIIENLNSPQNNVW